MLQLLPALLSASARIASLHRRPEAARVAAEHARGALVEEAEAEEEAAAGGDGLGGGWGRMPPVHDPRGSREVEDANSWLVGLLEHLRHVPYAEEDGSEELSWLGGGGGGGEEEEEGEEGKAAGGSSPGLDGGSAAAAAAATAAGSIPRVSSYSQWLASGLGSGLGASLPRPAALRRGSAAPRGGTARPEPSRDATEQARSLLLQPSPSPSPLTPILNP